MRAAVILLLSALVALSVAIEPEENLDSIGIIRHWGYPAEAHEVTTEDGYILTLHRIPHGRNGPGTNHTNRPVIFLQHGLECSSANWITNLPWESAGFMFADAGFDVWMGNMRGNTYSKRHQTLDPNHKDFWKFSYDEMAEYDLPAMIDFVLQLTKKSQLHYVGHSQGTMTMFAKASADPAFEAKIQTFFALAPVAHLGHIKGVLKYIARFTNDLGFLANLIGYDEFLPSSELTQFFAKYFCDTTGVDILCDDILFLIAGADSHQLNQTRIPVFVAHTPSGTSSQNMIHFGQNINNDKFQKYDYGQSKNEERYGQVTPPMYDVSTFTTPTYIFRGDLDILADPADVDWLEQQLTCVVKTIRLPEFNHLDFVWGLNAAAEIYDPIINIVKAAPVMGI
jgi:pimeloyl-ACP methyl ester carboxylesterase